MSPQTMPAPGERPQIPAMRGMLLVASILVFMAGFQLYVLTDYTARFFAWTINPPLTAAFLGASYWAAFMLEFMASRERLWARGRIAVPAVLLFTTLTLIATLLHFAPPFRLHLDSPDLITRGAAIAWIIVYAAVPPVMAFILWRQLQVPGGDPPRLAPLPDWLRYSVGVIGAIMLLFGIVMFLVPSAGIAVWPWTLTPLTSRAAGAWLLGLGIAAAQLARENDFHRVQPVLASAVAFGLLQFLALARYPSTVAWGNPKAWLYVLFMLSILVVGALGLLASRQVMARKATPRVA